MENVTYNDQMTKFEIGRTYYTRSICDADQCIAITIAKRTNCFVMTASGKRLKISHTYENVEMVKPWGSYSMAPQITAGKTITNDNEFAIVEYC